MEKVAFLTQTDLCNLIAIHFLSNVLRMRNALNTMSCDCKLISFTFPLSPGHKLWIFLSFFAFCVHEISEFLVMIDDPDVFLHFCVVLLQIFICFLLQQDHLGLSLISENKKRVYFKEITIEFVGLLVGK